MQLPATLLEALSWRLASLLTARHPDLDLIHTHPGGGQYDVLHLRSPRGLRIDLNRNGRIHLHSRDDGRDVLHDPWTWSQFLLAESLVFVRELEHHAGLSGDVDLSVAPPQLVHAAIAGLTCLAIGDEPLEVSQGFIDTSGGMGSHAAPWWEEMEALAPDLTASRSTDLFDQPGYRFWRVERSDFQLTFETTSGMAWTETASDADDLLDDEEARWDATVVLIDARQALAATSGAREDLPSVPLDLVQRALEAGHR